MSLKNKLENINNSFLIALDGPSGAGKGSLGLELANLFKLEYFPSSILYRGLAHLIKEQEIDIDSVKRIIELALKTNLIEYVIDKDLNNEIIGTLASKVASIAEIRKILNKSLHQILETTPRIIMEGRDIGTVIAPSADLKIYITADLEVRALRRHKQLLLNRKNSIIGEILQQLKERDYRDTTRDSAPLLPAEDALIIDTSNLTIEQVVRKVVEYVNTN